MSDGSSLQYSEKVVPARSPRAPIDGGADYIQRKDLGGGASSRGPDGSWVRGAFSSRSRTSPSSLKEPIIPASANKGVFALACSCPSCWPSPRGLIPVSDGCRWSRTSMSGSSILSFFAVSSLGVYGVMGRGGRPIRNMRRLSALRAAAQMVSYDGFRDRARWCYARARSTWYQIAAAPGHAVWLVRVVLAAALADVHRLLCFPRLPTIGPRST